MTWLIALLLLAEALMALLFASLYAFSYFSIFFTFVERFLIVTLFLATAASCFVAALALFNGWHLGTHKHSQWWRLSLVVAAGFNLAALAFDVHEFATGDWTASETLGFYVEFAGLTAMMTAIAFLALQGSARPGVEPPS